MPVMTESNLFDMQDIPTFQENDERVMIWDIPEIFPPGRATGSESSPMRVLLAEDNMIAQVTIRRSLERQGIEVVCAANGREAVDLFDDGRYDIVMLDILMPDIDGFEATSRIRAKELLMHAGQTPIIALTSYSLKAVNDKCRSVGMNGYLSKPVMDNDLKVLFDRLRGNVHEPVMNGTDGVDTFPVLDKDGCLDNLGGDLELYHEIIAMFIESAPQIVDGLVTALEAGDVAQAECLAHNLKGMAANIGAGRFSELARVIQNSVRTIRREEHEIWMARLREEFKNLMAALTIAGESVSP
jgi:two-component system sensor histidine kinase/response regulator